jgi:hypothetical protein
MDPNGPCKRSGGFSAQKTCVSGSAERLGLKRPVLRSYSGKVAATHCEDSLSVTGKLEVEKGANSFLYLVPNYDLLWFVVSWFSVKWRSDVLR